MHWILARQLCNVRIGAPSLWPRKSRRHTSPGMRACATNATTFGKYPACSTCIHLDSMTMPIGQKIFWSLASLGGIWAVCIGLLTSPWVQRQALYAHNLPITWVHDVDKPESFGFDSECLPRPLDGLAHDCRKTSGCLEHHLGPRCNSVRLAHTANFESLRYRSARG